MISITLIKQKVNTKIKILTLYGLVLLAVVGLSSSPVKAVTYDENAYGACAYQQVGRGCGSTGSELANTGQPFGLIAGVAAFCIGTGGLVLSLQRSRRRQRNSQI